MNNNDIITLLMEQNTGIPKGYKDTTIGIIPVDWDVKKLGDLGEVINGLTYSPNDINEEGILVLRSSNIKDRELAFLDNVYVLSEKYNPVKKDDILICVRNGSKSLIGKNALITDDAEGLAFGAFMAVYRSDYNKYLYHIFGTDLYQKEIHKNLGATINSINGSDLKLFKIALPSIQERQKIAEILSTWDEAITNCKTIINSLKARNKGLAQQLLTGKKRLSGFSEKWVELKADKIFRNNTDKTHNGELEILSATQERGVIPRSMNNIDIKYDVNSLGTYKKVEVGDYVISLRSFQGGIEYSEYEGIVSPAYTILKEIVPISKTFFKVYFKTETFISRLNTIIYGIRDGKQISFKDFATLKIPCPSKEEQIAIAQILETANREMKSYEDKLKVLQLQKKGLMQQLLTGKLRVNVN
jgi:type I restriction enzyme S subunit